MSERDEQQGKDGKGFTVVDRRASAGAGDAPATPAPQEPEAPAPAPSVDFSMLIQSFAITAMHHLGLVADPESGRRAERNLSLARQNIEILELLEGKTHGNLEEGESRLLASLLYEVRMHFVEAKEQQPQAPKKPE